MENNTAPQLDELMRSRPNVYGNTLVMRLLKLTASVLLVGFFVSGVLYVFHIDVFHINIIGLEWIAIGFFLLGICMAMIIWMGSMLVKRNRFIMAMRDWYKSNRN